MTQVEDMLRTKIILYKGLRAEQTAAMANGIELSPDHADLLAILELDPIIKKSVQ